MARTHASLGIPTRLRYAPRHWLRLRSRLVSRNAVAVPSRTVSWIVLLVALAVAVGAVAASEHAGLALAFGDGRSRLTIARTVIEGRQPGFAQLGNVWLPLHMLAMVPTIWIDWMYRTGASGIALSAIAVVVTAFYTHRFVYLVTGSHAASAVAALAVLAAPNFLFLGTNPMSAAPFTALSMGGWYYLAKWARTKQSGMLVSSATLLAAAAMIRYDGWFAIGPGALFVMLESRHGGRRAAAAMEGNMVAFLSPLAFVMMLWVFYNATIFRSPLAFATGQGSAAQFTQEASALSGFSTRGDLLTSIRVYGWTVLDTVGVVTTLAAAAGVAVAVLRWRQIDLLATLLLPASPIVFNVVSLFIGASVLYNPHVTPSLPLYNTRYGVMAVTFVAIGVGMIAVHNRLTAALAVALIACQAGLFFANGPLITVRDPLQGGYTLPYRTAAALNKVYDGGLVLIEFRDFADAMPMIHIPFNRFISEGVNLVSPTFPEAVRDPSRYVRFIVVREQGGQGNLAAKLSGGQLNNYEVVAHIGTDVIYKIRPGYEALHPLPMH